MLNTSHPSIPQGAFRGVLGGHKFNSLVKLSNGCTDWHQIWYMSADSSGNGHRLNTFRPTIHQVACRGGGGVSGSQIEKSGEFGIWYTSADSSGNGHRLNTIRPSIPQGVFWVFYGVTNSSLGKLPNSWTDWHQIWNTSVDSSGNGHRLKTFHPTIPQGGIWGV